jgi:putative ABC transport system permease protein
MLKNYFKVAYRNLIRYKGYSLLNIAGLSVGFTSFIFLFLFIRYELSFDKFHEKSNNIYRVVTSDFIGTPGLLGPYSAKEIPEVKNSVRIRNVTRTSGRMFACNNKRFNENKFAQADQSFFDIFSYKVLRGNLSTALTSPNSLVITKSIADKYFENEDPVGKSLNYENSSDYTITAVIEDMPQNSHFHFDLIAQFPNKPNYHWGEYNYLTYLLLSDNADINKVTANIGYVYKKGSGNTNNPFFLQKITDIHLFSHIRGEVETNGNMTDVYLYSAISVIILLIAGINYTNLSTASFIKRTKEIGIRKTLGAEKKQIIFQFLSESFILILISLIFALIMLEFFAPFAGDVIGRKITIWKLDSWTAIFYILGLAIMTGILSAAYPAFYLASLNPLKIIKNNSTGSPKGILLRKVLIVFQFAFSAFFLIFTLTISDQMNFLSKTRLGFEKDNILNIPIGRKYDEKYQTLKSELQKYPEIQNASLNDFLLSGNDYKQSTWWEGRETDDYDMMNWIPVDEDFIKTFKLKLKQGTDFSNGKEETEYILNESAVKYIGWDNPIGKQMKILEKGMVIGVVEDFNLRSLHTKIPPCALVFSPRFVTNLSLRISTADIHNTIAKIENVWKQVIPDRPFNFYFFDEDYNSLYKSEQQTGKIFNYAAVFAVFISCMGLLGLVSLSIERKTKEIAIRKVLGSSVNRVVFLLFKDFTVLIIIANIIIWPLAYILLEKWLENFAYRININLLLFLLAGSFSLLIAFIAAGYHTIKAATANPVNSLKNE